MPYDQSLDKQLFTKAFETDAGKIIVSVYSYNGGAKKMQMSRETTDKEGKPTFAKLGRMTKEEVEGVLPIIGEALKNL
jgi:predicted transcriptional regulator